MRTAPLLFAFLWFDLASRVAFAQAAAPPSVDDVVTEAPLAKPLPTDRSTGRLMGSWDNVAQALKQGDMGEAQRLASRLSSAQWNFALSTSTPQNLDAALSLLPSQVGAVAWLPVLAQWMLITTADQQDNLAKVLNTLGKLLDGSSPASATEWDVPVGTLRNVCRGFRWIAGDPDRHIQIRLAALEAQSGAQFFCEPAPTDLLVDPLPEIRRAAVPVVGKGSAALAALQARLDDDSPEVESMAAARLCRQNSSGAVTPELLRAARKFSAEPVSIEDSVELLDCLARSPNDRKVLESVVQHGNKVLRQRASELLSHQP